MCTELLPPGGYPIAVKYIISCRIISTAALPPPSSGPGLPHSRVFTITFRHTTLGRTPLDEWSARRRDLYLTKHNTHNRQSSMPTAVFELPIPGSERPLGSAYSHLYCCLIWIISKPTVNNELERMWKEVPSICSCYLSTVWLEK